MLLSNIRTSKNIENMPYPNAEHTMDGNNRLVYDELAYNKDELKVRFTTAHPTMTDKHKCIFATVMDVFDNNVDDMFLSMDTVAQARHICIKL